MVLRGFGEGVPLDVPDCSGKHAMALRITQPVADRACCDGKRCRLGRGGVALWVACRFTAAFDQERVVGDRYGFCCDAT